MSPHRLPESILREMWFSRFFKGTEFLTTDQLPVRILDAGLANDDAGPDVLDARILIGTTVFQGDVEFHHEAGSWYAHGHDHDEHYNRTILHLAFSFRPGDVPAVTESGRVVPLVIVAPPTAGTIPGIPDDPHLPCFDFNHSVPATVVSAWLTQLGRIRLERKVSHLAERMQQLMVEERPGVHEQPEVYGGNLPEVQAPLSSWSTAELRNTSIWEQLLYEGLMEASGYEKNRRPFLELARAMRLRTLRQFGLQHPETVMALLFGAAGFLSREPGIGGGKDRAQLPGLRRRWNELRPLYRGPVLHSGDWMFFRLRPANFPTNRLAGICVLLHRLFRNHSFRTLVHLFRSRNYPPAEMVDLLDRMLRAQPGPNWEEHFRFRRTAGSPVVTPGRARRIDMLANVILPTMILYGRTLREPEVAERSWDLYSFLPPLQENRITRLMAAELPGGMRPRSSFQHQGALYLWKEYCTRGQCGDCAIGRAVGLQSMPPASV